MVKKVEKLNIAFRCDASPMIGTGHVMRCMTLACCLKQYADITFYSYEESLVTVPELKRFNVLSPEQITGFYDWLIVDHYDLDKEFESEVRKHANRICVIDDLANRIHDCDILLDYTFGRNSSNYSGLVPQNCKLLMGTDYVLLRPEFLSLRGKAHRNFQSIRNVLISFGGVNPRNASQSALAVLNTISTPLAIDVVTGSKAQGLDEIQSLCNEMEKQGRHTVTLHVNTPHVADLMMKADICIGGGGTTSWERCVLGLPTIAVELADNQKKVLNVLSQEGALMISRLDDIGSTLSMLMKNPEKLESLSKAALKICDGRGTKRVTHSLLQFSDNPDNFILRLVTNKDLELIYKIQTIEGIRDFSRNPHPPSFDEHSQWFYSSMINPLREIYIIEVDNKAVGVLRLDNSIKNSQVEISIMIDPAFQKRGLAMQALKAIRTLYPKAEFIAEVLPGNDASHKLFQKSGYIKTDLSWYLSKPISEVNNANI